ncbi:MAG: hypothetical protein ISR96_01810 [Nitrospira sp.]|nr:hypothetical protein [Nitrospira sp.]
MIDKQPESAEINIQDTCSKAENNKLSATGELFIRYFEKFYLEVMGESFSTAVADISFEKLFTSLFNINKTEAARLSGKKVLTELIKHSYKIEAVLSRTFLHLTRDVIDNLIKRNSNFTEHSKIMTHIVTLSDLMIEAYFDVSRINIAHKPDIDQETQEYKNLLKVFNKYISEAKGENDAELEIHSYYRSIPIQVSAEVKYVGSDSVSFIIHPYEAVSLAQFRIAHLISPHHNATIRAYAKNIDIENKTVELSHFQIIDGPIEQRNYIRVEPHSYVKVAICIGETSISGLLYDISEAAIAVYIRNADLEPYVNDTNVSVACILPDIFETKDLILKVPGTIYKTYKGIKGDKKAHRIVVNLTLTNQLKEQISKYISHRQVEILKGLKELS